MKLHYIHSITRKLLAALLGAFLLVFLLFHMCANLLILAHDGGEAYNAFCHFMGSNLLVKIAETVLLGCFALHIVITVLLWCSNQGKRPVRYHQRSRSKTAAGSKLAIVSGSLLFFCMLFHFYDFYFVKVNLVKGIYMVKTEQLYPLNEKLMQALEDVDEATMDEYFYYFEATTPDENGALPDILLEPEYRAKLEANPSIKQAMHVVWYLNRELEVASKSEWLTNIPASQRDELAQFYPEARFEPDFYAIAHEKFSILHIVIGYLLFFFIVGLHIRHGFQSAFQTFGLNHYRYSRLIEVVGILYCWVICLGFASVPILVYLGI